MRRGWRDLSVELARLSQPREICLGDEGRDVSEVGRHVPRGGGYVYGNDAVVKGVWLMMSYCTMRGALADRV
jgi:hypothetical protein